MISQTSTNLGDTFAAAVSHHMTPNRHQPDPEHNAHQHSRNQTHLSLIMPAPKNTSKFRKFEDVYIRAKMHKHVTNGSCKRNKKEKKNQKYRLKRCIRRLILLL